MPPREGGNLCLDFANTVGPRGSPSRSGPPSHDYLSDYTDLVAWELDSGALTEGEALRLLKEAVRQPRRAVAIFERAIILREAIYRVFWTIAQGEAPASEDLRILEREHREAVTHARLVATEDGFAWAWQEEAALGRALWPVAQAATDLLTSGKLGRVKVCPGLPGDPVPCALLFYDASKNRIRRWCSMADCGSTVKARRLTARRRATRQQRLR